MDASPGNYPRLRLCDAVAMATMIEIDVRFRKEMKCIELLFSAGRGGDFMVRTDGLSD